ncbi:MAG: GFA family protein [Pseudomonadota bacterium]
MGGARLPLSGGCQCSSLRWEATAWPRAMVRCHCDSCKAQSAASFGTSIYFAPDTLRFTGPWAEFTVKTARNGRKRCVFCPRCGVRVAHIGTPNPPHVSIKGGTIDPHHRLRPAADVWTDARLAWVPVLEEGLSYPGQPECWTAVERRFAQDLTLSFYDAEAAEYAQASAGQENNPRLQNFIGALPKSAHVLDLACGSGWAAASMRGAGLQVTATDASAGLAEQARLRYGQPVELAYMQDLSACEAYHGIWAHFALIHLPRDEWPDMLGRLHRALRRGGQLSLSVREGLNGAKDRLGRHITRVTNDELDDMLRDAGFRDTRLRITAPLGEFDGTNSRSIIAETQRGA